MSTFPAIRPAGRSFTPGTVPVSSFVAVSGKETRVILGDTPMGHELSLTLTTSWKTLRSRSLTITAGN